MIRALIFDVGGVLLRTEDLAGRRKWEARFGMADWELADLVFNSLVALAATLGQAPESDVWEHVRVRLKLSDGELSELREDFWSGDRLDESLLDWIAARRGPYRTCILSNAWSGARKFLAGRPGVAAAFEEMVISAEEGLMKPQVEIYRRALERVDVAPAEAVFVDDVLANVQAAQAVGLAVIHYQPGLDVPRAMKALGVQAG